MIGLCTINGMDAFGVWGIVLDSTALSVLMTPPPLKDLIENKSRLEHGKRVIINNPKVDERVISLKFNLRANTEVDFFSKYESFCRELAKGNLRIHTKFQPDVFYNMVYQSCTQFTQYSRGRASFILKLSEPNPGNRE